MDQNPILWFAWFTVAIIAPVLSQSIDFCSNDDHPLVSSPQIGVALSYSFYDQWTQNPSDATSMCRNHDQFFANGNDRIAAISYGAFSNSEACGACINVTSTSTGNSVVLSVIETINRANPGDLQVSQRILNQLAGQTVYQIPTSYTFIECPAQVVEGNLKYQFSVGSNVDSSSMFISNAKIPIREVSANSYWLAREAGGPFGSMYWKMPPAIKFPIQIRAIGSTNEEIKFTVPSFANFEIVDTVVQFSGQCFAPRDSSTDPSTSGSTDEFDSSSSSTIGSVFYILVSILAAAALFVVA
jgi:hypothetical protein